MIDPPMISCWPVDRLIINIKWEKCMIPSVHINIQRQLENSCFSFYTAEDSTLHLRYTLQQRIPHCILDLHCCRGSHIVSQIYTAAGDPTLHLGCTLLQGILHCILDLHCCRGSHIASRIYTTAGDPTLHLGSFMALNCDFSAQIRKF